MDAIRQIDCQDSGTFSRAEEKRLLRFLTCGSVDDGKSTLIGRLLHDSKLICDDHLSVIERDSRKYGTLGEDIDLAYRYFTTPRRSFIVADTPGHEQYTRNMATGASTADLAVLLVDVRRGILTQTKRHSFICSLLGIRTIVLAVNKIDLVNFSAKHFNRIVADYAGFASTLNFQSITAIPTSARFGDNVTRLSERTPWYGGPTLLAWIETIEVEDAAVTKPLRFPVQWVNRPNSDFRGVAGTVASGTVTVGDSVVAACSGKQSRVERIVTFDGDRRSASAGEAVTLTLTDEIDVARGELLVAPRDRAQTADQFAACLLWMSDEPMLPGRSYLLR